MMKFKIKSFKVLACITVVFSLVFSNFIYASSTQRYKDVKTTDWYYNTIEKVSAKNLFNGDNGYFCPKNSITVAEFTTVLVRARGDSISSTATSPWYKRFVDDAKSIGVIQNGDFTDKDYLRPITRGEMVRMIYRAFTGERKLVNPNVNDTNKELYQKQIKDWDSISDSLKECVFQAYTLGIISGYPDGTFGVQDKATRAEAAVMILRLVDDTERKYPTLTATDDINTDSEDELVKELYKIPPTSGIDEDTGKTIEESNNYLLSNSRTKANVVEEIKFFTDFANEYYGIDYRNTANLDDLLLRAPVKYDPHDDFANYIQNAKTHKIIMEAKVLTSTKLCYLNKFGDDIVRAKIKFRYTSIDNPRLLPTGLKLNTWYEKNIDVRIACPGDKRKYFEAIFNIYDLSPIKVSN